MTSTLGSISNDMRAQARPSDRVGWEWYRQGRRCRL